MERITLALSRLGTLTDCMIQAVAGDFSLRDAIRHRIA